MSSCYYSSVSTMPPGYRFEPTHEELVSFYLPRKLRGLELFSNAVIEMDVYGREPRLFMDPNEGSKYYFVKRERKSESGKGKTPRREIEGGVGWWKATSGDKEIKNKHGRVVGYVKTLIYFTYNNDTQNRTESTKTNWIMYEYKLSRNTFQEWVLCSIKYHKKKAEEMEVDDSLINHEVNGQPGNQLEFVDEQQQQQIMPQPVSVDYSSQFEDDVWFSFEELLFGEDDTVA